jgi:cytochrome c biogenesis protein CcdA
MFDPVSGALRATSVHSAWAFPVVFAAGAFSSFGPCVAPRFIAVAGMSAGRRPRETAMLVGAFVCGLAAAYACFGAVASVLGKAVQYSTVVYAILAIALACAGSVTLWGFERHSCANDAIRKNTGAGASFLFGAFSALVVSPCCTPLAIAVIAYTSASADPLYGSGLLAAFAIGHALPLIGAGAAAHHLSTLVLGANLRNAANTVGAALMLALAAYYAVLA